MTQVCGIPISRAYWELKAEQVMNRVFAPEASIDLEIIEAAPSRVRVVEGTVPGEPRVREVFQKGLEQPEPTPVRTNTSSTPNPELAGKQHLQSVQKRLNLSSAPPEQLVWMGGLTLMALLLAGATLTGLGFWGQYQQSLQQERNMMLIERLRSLTPASQGSEQLITDRTNGHGSVTGTGNGPELPPPPPEEPWMQELSSLPSSNAPAARLLQVPLHQRVTAGAPPEARPLSRGSQGVAGDLPQLVGVIQAPGQQATAMFQVAGTAANAGIGETIGNTGWRLRSANGDSAVIERDGNQRRLSISSGL